MSIENYDPDEMMDRAWVASRLKVKPSVISAWVKNKDHTFPKGVKLGDTNCAKRIWRRSVIEDWIVSCESATDAALLAPTEDRPAQLYRHWDSTGQLLYIGISISAFSRLAGHRNASEWFKQIAMVTIEHFDTTSEAEAAEIQAIKSEKPLYNIKHNQLAA